MGARSDPRRLPAAFGTAFAAGDGLAVTVAAYRGLATQAGAAGVDISKISAGSGAGPNAADSGTTTATTTAANELKLGIYADQGTTQTLDAGTLDTTYSTVVKQDANGLGETLIEDASSGPAGSTARATASLLGAGIPDWGMAVLVYKLSGSGLDHFTYAYDGLNRLKSSTGPVAEGFTLDSASNITARTGPAATYAIDTANRPTSDGTRPFTWSTADRLVGRGADTFGYDPLDRLTSSTVAGTARTYAYNGDNLLQSRSGANPATFLWDPSSSSSRLLQQGTDRIVYGLGPLYIVRADGTTAAFATDGLGSVRAEVSGTGAVSSSFRYRAYGEIAQSSGATSPSLLGYAGELQDPSGLIYLRARWYDPGVGRFMSRDPATGSITNPVSLNAFAYASARPGLLTDPSGLDSFTPEDELEQWLANQTIATGLDSGAAYIASRLPVRTAYIFEYWTNGRSEISEFMTKAVPSTTGRLLNSVARSGITAGIAQGVTDYLFHKELTPGQRVGRIAVAAAVAVAAVAAAPIVLGLFGLGTAGVGGFMLATGTSMALGAAFDAVVRPRVYPAFSLGVP